MKIELVIFATASLVAGQPLQAQDEVPSLLSLEEALEIARANNPSYRQVRNDIQLADWGVRQAYGSLLPSANASGGTSWQGAGEQQFGSLTLGDLGFLNQPSYYFSNYFVGLNYSLDWATLRAPSLAKADRRVIEAQIGQAGSDLEANVTSAYVEALRQQEALRVSELQLENSQFNLRLAEGQLEVGTVTAIDVGQAEVQVGRSQVMVLQSRNALETARMRILQQLGLQMGSAFELSTDFTLSPPVWNVEDLRTVAFSQNPNLETRRRSRESAEINVSSARSSYFPSLSISTGLSGFARQASNTDFQVAQAEARIAGSMAQCHSTNDLYSRLATPLPPLNCSQFTFTDVQRQSITDSNDQFPFGFQGSPPSVQLQMSIPIFQGLSRQRNVEAARLQRDDLLEQIREQEIALEADISIGLANVRTAYESALLEERNRELADQQLRLARERYQLGEITFVDLVAAQTVLAQAEADQIAAVFAYHDLVTTLESLVGTSLRN